MYPIRLRIMNLMSDFADSYPNKYADFLYHDIFIFFDSHGVNAYEGDFKELLLQLDGKYYNDLYDIVYNKYMETVLLNRSYHVV